MSKNRIVVDYGEYKGLVLLAAFDTTTGKEVDRSELEKLTGFDVVKKYDGIDDYTTIKELIQDNEEGFVIRFKNGFRMKIKGNFYCYLHKILTNVSTRSIWEYLKEGKSFDELLERVPDEFYDWVRETKEDLELKFKEIKDDIEIQFRMLVNKREFAENVSNNSIKHLLFKRLDSYSPQLNSMIWDMLYPAFEKPFKKIIIDDE